MSKFAVRKLKASKDGEGLYHVSSAEGWWIFNDYGDGKPVMTDWCPAGGPVGNSITYRAYCACVQFIVQEEMENV